MANTDVRSALDTLNSAIQALSVTALEAAVFSAETYTDSAAGTRWRIIKMVRDLQTASAAAKVEFDAFKVLDLAAKNN